MASKYIDTPSIVQVIGCVFKTPQLLDYSDKYTLTEEDFPDQFHKIVFGTIFKLHELGSEKIGINNILDYLSSRPKSEAIFIKQKGEEWLLKAAENAEISAFDYYYNRVKKMTLLRAFDSYGIDVTDIYDPDNIIDIKKKQLQEDQLDNSSLEEIVQKVQNKIDQIMATYVDDEWGEAIQAGDGIESLIIDLEQSPEVGVPLYGPLINTVTRGARLKKFYLRSAPTGVGKSRTMIADACYIACNRIYDDVFGWIKNGTCEPTLYITTEQEKGEVQTMMLAFLSNVNEEHILNGKYEGDERERVFEAAKILHNSPLYIEILPDFSLQDVENKIKKNIRDHDVKYVFHDYIHTSLKILEEISRRSGGVKLREDSILFMLSIRLKDICNKYGIFIMSATQLNEGWSKKEIGLRDQNCLRGSKAIADKIDIGLIGVRLGEEEYKQIDAIWTELKKQNPGKYTNDPNIVIDVYKNRRGELNCVKIFRYFDYGTCHCEDLFVTDPSYKAVNEIGELKFEKHSFDFLDLKTRGVV